MKMYDSIIEGLQLLKKYDPHQNVCAEHDILYAGPDYATEVSEEDHNKLIGLGWLIDRESGRWAIYP